MSITKKITTGYVVQMFDEHGQCVGQEFTASDDPVEYETPDGMTLEDSEELEGLYHSFDMAEPVKEKDLKYTLVCRKCGGSEIQSKCWVDSNTNKYIGETEDDDNWCDDCQEHVRLCTKEDFENDDDDDDDDVEDDDDLYEP